MRFKRAIQTGIEGAKKKKKKRVGKEEGIAELM
jgi:hypothetical protein